MVAGFLFDGGCCFEPAEGAGIKEDDSNDSPSIRRVMAQPDEEAEQKVDPSKTVKEEPREDEAPAARKQNQKKEDSGVLAPKRKKDEEDDAREDEPGNEDDAMAPEAEPTCSRHEVPAGAVKFREEAVHVYGLDFLKTGHMEEIFGQFNHRYIEWINDSSANVIFRDAASARKALESLSYPKAGDEPWRRTPDILVHDDLPAVFLQMRLAAPSDAKPRKHSFPSAKPSPFVDEAEPRNQQFTMASLYDKGERKKAANGAAQKRSAEGVPEEEVAKRRKRRERFGPTEEVSAAPEAAKSTEATEPDPTAPVAAEPPAARAVAGTATEEDEAKREKRALRFGTAVDTPETPKAAAAEPPQDAAAEPPQAAAATTQPPQGVAEPKEAGAETPAAAEGPAPEAASEG